MRCAIVANGAISDYKNLAMMLSQCHLIISCDGGARHLEAVNISPGIVLGDFDSIPEPLLESYKKSGLELMAFPPEKNMTDSHLAVDVAIKRGCMELLLFGVTGSRLDHTLSNIFLLSYIESRGALGKIIDDNNTMFLAAEQTTVVHGKPGQILSLVAISDIVKGITLAGLKYPLQDATLHRYQSLGVSNEFVTDTAVVNKSSGDLLIILSKD